jgi:hypothetical protein
MLAPRLRGQKPRLVKPAGVFVAAGSVLFLAVFGVIPSNVVKIRPTPLNFGDLSEPSRALVFSPRNAAGGPSRSDLGKDGAGDSAVARQLVPGLEGTPRTALDDLDLPPVDIVLTHVPAPVPPAPAPKPVPKYPAPASKAPLEQDPKPAPAPKLPALPKAPAPKPVTKPAPKPAPVAPTPALAAPNPVPPASKPVPGAHDLSSASVSDAGSLVQSDEEEEEEEEDLCSTAKLAAAADQCA